MHSFQNILSLILETTPEQTKMYRELSMALHPDTGGSNEEMAKLNAAKQDGDWDTIRRMYAKYVELEDESEVHIKRPDKVTELFRLYKTWSSEIRDELSTQWEEVIKIIPELQGNSVNAWVYIGKNKNVFVPKIDRFRTKKDFKNEVLKKIKSR